MKLLKNLDGEKGRWSESVGDFARQMSTVTGDCMLVAAFIAYIGYFDQSYRAMLLEQWQEQLERVSVKAQANLSIINYLSTSAEQLEWQSHKLPADELATENAIIMKCFNRYPLIIDPSGQATEFLQMHYVSKKIVTTSFLSGSFVRDLEVALRFGNALLVEDVEKIDAVLNPVLNREVFKQGGRVMITVGNHEVDFSPSFTLFMTTRDPTCYFTPDLCSRVTFVNFTVTHASLKSQCLSKALKSERPDVDKKFAELMQLQGGFRVKLRELEDKLLDELNSVKGGNILDDDRVMTSLESLKVQAGDIMDKMSKSEEDRKEVDKVTALFEPLAISCSSLYFTLDRLPSVHQLYQFSLNFFMSVVDKILTSERAGAGSGAQTLQQLAQRLDGLTKKLFSVAFSRVARGMLQKDHVILGLRFAQIVLDESTPAPEVDPYSSNASAGKVTWVKAFYPDEMNFLINSTDFVATGQELVKVPRELNLNQAQIQQLTFLAKLPGLGKLVDHLESNTADWVKFISGKRSVSDEAIEGLGVPSGWENVDEKIAATPRGEQTKFFRQLLVVKVIRTDLLNLAAEAFVASVFGEEFLDKARAQTDLAALVADPSESNCFMPFLLVSLPGNDPSQRVDQLAISTKQQNYKAFAMGSEEGYALATDAINEAAKKGTWVLLKNVHLSPGWLADLEKTLHRNKSKKDTKADFRLFMTMEMSDRVPNNLLRLCSKLIYEPPVGLKASLARSFATVPVERVNKAPKERSRLFFLMAWLHGVILERLRYTPIGWSKKFDFGESDQLCALHSIDEWVDRTAGPLTNIAPQKLPWGAFVTTLESALYGGRMDNEFDQARLSAFVRSVFTKDAFDLNFPLSKVFESSEAGAGKPLFQVPDCTDHAGFSKWIDALPDDSVKNPVVLGLPSDAERMLLEEQALRITKQLGTLQDQQAARNEVLQQAKAAAAAAAAAFDTQADSQGPGAASVIPKWMLELRELVERWLEVVPPIGTLKTLQQCQPPKPALAHLTPELALIQLFKHPLFRAMHREVNGWISLLKLVVTDLKEMLGVLSGTGRSNNNVRMLFSHIHRNEVPITWKKLYPPLKPLAASVWIEDFVQRIAQMQKLSCIPIENLGQNAIWLGGMMSPEAFVAATRQSVAQNQGWSLEQTQLKVIVQDGTQQNDSSADADSYLFDGVRLAGAIWKPASGGQKAGLSIDPDNSGCAMPPLRFQWVKITEEQFAEAAQAAASGITGAAAAFAAGKDVLTVQTPIYLDRSRKVFILPVRIPCPDTIPTIVWAQRSTSLILWNSAADS